MSTIIRAGNKYQHTMISLRIQIGLLKCYEWPKGETAFNSRQYSCSQHQRGNLHSFAPIYSWSSH